MLDHQLWIDIRQALLLFVGAIERALGITPTTKELRDRARREKRGE
jgi:hypothetical protein